MRIGDVYTALEVSLFCFALCMYWNETKFCEQGGVFTEDWQCVSRLVQQNGTEPPFWKHLLTLAFSFWQREGRLEPAEKTDKPTDSVAKSENIIIEDIIAHMIKAIGPIAAYEMITGSEDLSGLALSLTPVVYRHFIHAINVDIQHKELVYWMVHFFFTKFWLSLTH